jgi:glutathione S-transferase
MSIVDVDRKIAARRFEVLCDGVCDAVVLTFFERMRSDEARSPEWILYQ